MNMFDKKPSIFDENQDKALKALAQNQSVLIKNNSYFIETIKKLWAWQANLDARAKDLEARMTANEKRDSEQAALFANLSKTASQTEAETT